MACSDVKDCYSTTDTNGRSVAETNVAKLEKEGYKIRQLDDIPSDYGMKIYEMRKEAGKPVEYLHIIWGNGKGTRTLMLPERIDNWEQLSVIAKL